jgi:hypothetical protein
MTRFAIDQPDPVPGIDERPADRQEAEGRLLSNSQFAGDSSIGRVDQQDAHRLLP